LPDYSLFSPTDSGIKHNYIHLASPARSFVHGLVMTILSVMIVFQTSVTLIFGPTIPDVAATVSDFNIAAVGDWGCRRDTTLTVNNIVSKNTEVTIGLGDNSYYEPTADCWFQRIAPIESQMYTALGNHDVNNAELLAQYMNHFNMQEQYFSFNYQNVHFLVMSTETAHNISSAQYNFVHYDLQNAASNQSIDWIIVANHRPAYISPHNSGSLSSSFRHIYHPIFQQYDVDLVLQAHHHAYERSYPLKFNSTDPSYPIIDTSSTRDYNDPDGQIFATVGTGGQYSYHFTGKDAAFVTQLTDTYGFLNIDILNDGKTLKATFFENDGTTRDQFTIQKDQSSPPPYEEKCQGIDDVNSKYNYAPCLTVDANEHYDVPSSSNLQLDVFSVAAWFKTTEDHTGDVFIVNKGGTGSDAEGRNMNYGIWVTSSEKIRAGFETSTGANYFVTSPAAYNDGKWHYIVATYDGSSTVTLYIDGKAVASTSTSGALPDKTAIQPLRIGANSFSYNGYFVGDIDEVRVWNRGLLSTEISSQYNNGAFNATGQVAHLSFSLT
jgi:concanavalin A-like lectin/glucanase superfamily protein/calcineurin-like phosphoesterase family protein